MSFPVFTHLLISPILPLQKWASGCVGLGSWLRLNQDKVTPYPKNSPDSAKIVTPIKEENTSFSLSLGILLLLLI